ncbi:MAG: GNAT family N-acetyltransferase [Chthonomonadaceae bacterium]|nr:GNAT family N-acetyltransferase [Chthonomonadaceae bacterium]
MNQAVTVRLWQEKDGVEELTALLHRAYSELADQGWNYTASYQDEAQTLSRVSRALCHLAYIDDSLVGTANLVIEFDETDPPDYLVPGTGVLGQFGVDPDYRHLGVGDVLLEAVIESARDQGLMRLCLDTASVASKLLNYYERRGFRQIGLHQWPGKTYASVVMEKTL